VSKYTVEIIRFKKSGKFYDYIGYATDSDWFFDLKDEMKRDIREGVLTDSFNYMVTGQLYIEEQELYSGEDHPNGFPMFIES